MNDAQRVELLLLPGLMTIVIREGMNNPRDLDDRQKTLRFLAGAVDQAICDLPLNRQHKLLRRADRLVEQIRIQCVGTHTMGLVTYFLLSDVTECGYLSMGDQSPLWMSCQEFLEAMKPAADDEDLWEDCRSRATVVLMWLQSQRYFEGVPSDGG